MDRYHDACPSRGCCHLRFVVYLNMEVMSNVLCPSSRLVVPFLQGIWVIMCVCAIY